MKVLVAYASKYGATEGIAESIAERLREEPFDVDTVDVGHAQALDSYDAFVIGSALYMGHWMKEARTFVTRNRGALTGKPVWLFSSGPTGRERINSKGHDVLEASTSGPLELEELKTGLRVAGHRVFFGAFDPENLGYLTRQLFKSKTLREATPTGDFRDWKDIEQWAGQIGLSLRKMTEVPIEG